MAEQPKIALSHSRLSDFNQCPRKFKLKYLDKAPNMNIDDASKNVHLVRGQNVHKALEKYVIRRNAGEQNIAPSSLPEVENTVPYLSKLYNAGMQLIPEQQISVDSDYKAVDWFSKQSYWRAIFDLISLGPSTASIDDYKTGKFKEYDAGPSGYGQLHLSALIGLSLMPQIEVLTAKYLYVDHKKTIEYKFTQNDLPKLRSHFDAEHMKVNNEANFDPKKNQYCSYCDATKAQCPYSTKMDVRPLVFQPKEQ